MKDIYVCSKPLQWFNARNIPNNNTIPKVLIFINTYKNANLFFEKIKNYDYYWDEVYLVNSRKESRILLRKFTINSLFVDCDYGILGYLYSRIEHKQFCLYEEGIGNYTNILKRSKYSPIKGILLSLLGSGPILGTSRFTDLIYLHNPRYYLEFCRNSGYGGIETKVVRFEDKFFNLMSLHINLLTNIFKLPEFISLIKKKRICLYLLNYHIRNDALDFIIANEKKFDMVIFKAHPNFKYDNIPTKIPIQTELHWIREKGVMAEFLIQILNEKEKGNTLTIINEGSTSCIYLDPNEVTIINLASLFNRMTSDFKKTYFNK